MPATKSPPKVRRTNSLTPEAKSRAIAKRHNITPERLKQLSAASKTVRADIATHRDEIDAEADRLIAAGLADGSMVKVSVLLKGGDDARIVKAIDDYAQQHGLQSRSHVVRVALAKLLKLNVTAPKWGWQKGRARKEPIA